MINLRAGFTLRPRLLLRSLFALFSVPSAVGVQPALCNVSGDPLSKRPPFPRMVRMIATILQILLFSRAARLDLVANVDGFPRRSYREIQCHFLNRSAV
jgi:hypothetical protein